MVVGSRGTGFEASGSTDLPSVFVNLIELNFGSTASEKVIEILVGAGPVESGAGTVVLGWACANADCVSVSAKPRMKTTGRNVA